MTIPEIPDSVEQELLRYSPLKRRLLFRRGITTKEAARKFLFPSYEDDVYDPFLMKNLSTAVDRIHDAISRNEKIVVYADYDCDGIPGAVLFHDVFTKIGYKNFSVYIPDRHKEGYGLNQDAVQSIIEQGAKLLITVDLGITGHAEVLYAHAHGLEVIVTDHHLPHETLPPALFVVNPKQKDETYPYDMLCGAGVAFKILQGFLKRYGEEFSIPEGYEKWLLDMVGLATLADLVPLRDENRVFAYYGMKVLQKTRRKGLLSLMRKNNLRPGKLQDDDVTFTICPRLNAASRMDHPQAAFDLLIAATEEEASASAAYLTKINNKRKTLVATIMRHVHVHLEARQDHDILVIGDTSWRVGVLGIVASKIVETYNKTAFVWGLEGSDVIKGSCRSNGEVHVVDLMNQMPKESLLEFGGHEHAGGFSVSKEEIHFLSERLNDAHNHIEKKKPSENSVVVDAHLSLDDVNRETYEEIKAFAPFGVENPKPVFVFDHVLVSSVRAFGKYNDHIEILCKNSRGRDVKAIQFFSSFHDLPENVREGKHITITGNIEYSSFGWKEEIRIRIIDVR